MREKEYAVPSGHPEDRRLRPAGPDQLYGDLFTSVQALRLFGDGKTFPDMEPRRSPAEIMAAWTEQRPKTEAEIRAFVSRHFAPPLAPPVGVETHALPISRYIRTLWDKLSLEPAARGPHSSALPLPHPHVVPGGRFREIYYWDSYFTMLGLAADGRQPQIEQMLDNFVSLIERYGHVPNGTRSYYLSRSQPPFLALMLGLASNADPAVRLRRLAALRTEHAFWMQGASQLEAPGASAREHVVRLADGSLLNRYWDAADAPRPEAYAEDIAVANRSERPSKTVYRDLRAAAESGWDFSSRWLADGGSMSTIRTTALIPVDLNALLYFSERRIASECAVVGDAVGAAHFLDTAARRAAAVQRHCWIEGEGRFADWLWTEGRATPGVTAATLYPLFVGLATEQQAEAVAAVTQASLLAPGGLRTTTVRSGQQWDIPNGWAPLQWIAIVGLRRYGHHALADTIAERWLATVEWSFAATGVLLEKYDIEEHLPAAGGEYPNQEGFGWTNGVVQALMLGADRRVGDNTAEEWS